MNEFINLGMYVCMHSCMYVCMYVCMFVSKCECRACECRIIWVCLYVCNYVCIYKHVYVFFAGHKDKETVPKKIPRMIYSRKKTEKNIPRMQENVEIATNIAYRIT